MPSADEARSGAGRGFCYDFLNSTCTRDPCPFDHVEKQVESRDRAPRPCFAFQKGNCEKGDSCGFAHIARPQTYQVFVTNLGDRIDDRALRYFFASCGDVVNVNIPVNRDTGRPKPMAFVSFAERDAVDRAVDLAGRILEGRPLRIEMANNTR
jgi:hypothetical protein